MNGYMRDISKTARISINRSPMGPNRSGLYVNLYPENPHSGKLVVDEATEISQHIYDIKRPAFWYRQRSTRRAGGRKIRYSCKTIGILVKGM